MVNDSVDPKIIDPTSHTMCTQMGISHIGLFFSQISAINELL